MNDNQKRLVQDPISFWDERHRDFDPWRSGGDRGLSAEENQEFYDLRLAILLRLIRRHYSIDRSIRILDAGCGRGHLTDALRRVGHVAVGFDSSESAVQAASDRYGGSFFCSTLQGLRVGLPYNVIVCVDVLFHILDDVEWARAVDGICGCASAEAIVVVSDAFSEERRQIHDYIVHRAATDYARQFASHGFERIAFEPYAFGLNPNGFAVFKRTL